MTSLLPSHEDVTLTTAMRVPPLYADEQDELNRLLTQWTAKKTRNLLRAAYYDGKNAVNTIGISTPPNFRNVATVLGWPAKAVDVLNRRCNLDGFVIPGGSAADLGIPEMWADNNLDGESPQWGISSLIHSCAFIVTTRGDTEAGEPPVVLTGRDALSSTGIWEPRRRVIRSFLSIIATDEAGGPTEMVMYLPGGNVFMTNTGRVWRVERREHSLGRVPVELLPYQPRLGRPFGSSRISRAVMSLTDSALRTVIRSEVSAEFYSAPQRYLLGADEKAFQDANGNVKTQWQAIIGRIWAIDRDEDGEVPTVGQFPQSSQQPHMDQLRAWAQLFAGETSIPVSSLGISSEANPASAEAYHASREDLIQEAEGVTDAWGPAYCRAILTGIQLRDELDEIPAEFRALRAKWRNPATPSRAAAADAGLKTIQAFPWIAETEVGLEMMGFDQPTVDRLLAERRRLNGAQALRAITEAAQRGAPGVAEQ